MLFNNLKIREKIIERLVIFLLLLSVSFSISYWAMAKYDLNTDYTACGDASFYIKMSKHDYIGVPQPYRYRILMPSLVSLLNDHFKIGPFLSKYYKDVDKKMIQLNFSIINMLALALTACIFFYYCLCLQFSKAESLIGSLLFLTSFFVVNYYTIPMVDSMAVLFIMAGFYAALKGSLLGLFLSFLFGMFTKETTFLILPLILLKERKFLTKKLLVCLPGLILYIIFIINFNDQSSPRNFYIFRDVLNMAKGHYIKVSLREFSFYTVIENMQIFMFLWALFIYALFKCKIPLFLKRIAWLLLIPLFTPLFPTAQVGRVVFYLFPIVIPFAILALRNILERDG